jgi:dephospho-CoA kinase
VLRIGLTGGIASGKSTVAGLFAGLGIAVIDTDTIARELTAPGAPALAEIVRAFGSGILNDAGTLDRRRLRGLVFGDPAKRRRLEAILHPLIRAEALARADAAESPYVLLAVPLLFESGFDRLVDRSLVVDCPEPVQLERLQRRDGSDAAEARARLAAQMPRAHRLAAADDIIDNGGSRDALRDQVDALHRRYINLAQNCSSRSSRAE